MPEPHGELECFVHLFSAAVRTMAKNAGKPQAFHQTVTIAFLSLIAERMQTGQPANFADFGAANPELLQKSLLSRWYRAERLASDLARHTFVLPDPAS
jgi:hypothetical protein